MQVDSRGSHVAGGVDARVRHVFPQLSALALELPSAELKALARMPGVLLVEPDPERHVAKAPASGDVVPSRDNGLYGLVTTRVVDVHKRKLTGKGQTICIIDEGLDAAHPDLAPNYVGGVDTFAGDGDPDVGASVEEQHGTSVAAVAMSALNGVGIRGVAYGAKFYHARVLPGEGAGRASDVMDGTRIAVETSGCRIVNISLGGSRDSALERDFYADLAAQGVLVVASAGNQSSADRTGPVTFPGAYESVLAVGAVDVDNQHAGFDSTGPELDLSAPGVAVLTAVPRGTGPVEASVKTAKATFGASVIAFAGVTTGVSARLVDCGSGQQCPTKVSGNVALIARSDAPLAEQLENAMDAGAIAAVFRDSDGSPVELTLGAAHASDGRAWIPAVFVDAGTGASLRRSLNKPVTVADGPSSWARTSGSSLAAPLVSGVAALMLQVNPSLSVAELTDILEQTATPLGDGRPNAVFGWGLVNADAAVKEAVRRH